MIHCGISYPQNGDRIVTIDPVTSLHPVYRWDRGHYVFALTVRLFVRGALAEAFSDRLAGDF